jgi:phosphohistidine phosphatase
MPDRDRGKWKRKQPPDALSFWLVLRRPIWLNLPPAPIMNLYFLRHGDAINGMDDASRLLSPEGKRQAAQIGSFLKKAGISMDAIYSSPLIRAAQTAEIVGAALSSHGRVKPQLMDALLNETPQAEFTRWLREIGEVRNCLLVGHMPTLSERAAHLLKMHDPDTLSFPKCGLACIEILNSRNAALRFFVWPGLL